MAYVTKVGGRSFEWHGDNRLNYVKKSFPSRWQDASPESATHVIHAWLPTCDAAWEFTVRKIGEAR